MANYKHFITFFILLCITLFGCSDNASETTTLTPSVNSDNVMEKYEEITKKSILANFVNFISAGKHDQAFAMLHPKLSEAWTEARFVNDWDMIKKQLPSGLQPEATGSFSGTSPNGPYEQATYRLESNWRSLASLDLISMKVDGKDKIVKVHIRIPIADDSPVGVRSQTDAFIASMLKKDYDNVQKLFSDSCKRQYPPAILGRLRTILGHSSEDISRSYYRLCANTVWYDVVLLKHANDPATHLELIMQTTEKITKIVTMTFKGRM